MKRYIALPLLAGCFFGGPSPTEATKATVLFSLDLHPIFADPCVPGPFIGNVAIGDEFAYVATHAFLPACTGGNGDAELQIKSSVYEFSKTTGGIPKTFDAGLTQEGGGAPRARVAASGNEMVWTYSERGGMDILVRSKSGLIDGMFRSTSNNGPTLMVAASLILDASSFFVGVWSGPQGPDNPLHPKYPCCGGGGGGGATPMARLYRVTNAKPPVETALPPEVPLYTEQMKDALVANSTLLFLVRKTSPQAVIESRPKDGSPTGAMVATLSEQPAGLAANDTHVAFATGVDFRLGEDGACRVAIADAAPPHANTELLTTNSFACLDVALDDTHVYFNIVELADTDNQEDFLRNVGVGRVNIVTKEFESIKLGIVNPETGPRELFVDGNGIILVAPYLVARIDKSDFVGKHEIGK